MGLFHSGSDYDNPADSAMPYLEQIPGTITPYYQPYIDWGMDAGQIMSDQYGRMATDPQGYYSDIMGGYQESPGYQYQSEQLQKQMSGDASAGGFTGTEYDQQRQADTIQGLLAKDQEQYFRDVTGSQKEGLQGESHMFDTGYGASSGLADALASNLAQEAGLQFAGTSYENQLNQAQRNSWMKLLGQGLGAGGAIGTSYFLKPSPKG